MNGKLDIQIVFQDGSQRGIRRDMSLGKMLPAFSPQQSENQNRSGTCTSRSCFMKHQFRWRDIKIAFSVGCCAAQLLLTVRIAD